MKCTLASPSGEMLNSQTQEFWVLPLLGIGLLEPGIQNMFLIKMYGPVLLSCVATWVLRYMLCKRSGYICLIPPGNAKGQAAGNM